MSWFDIYKVQKSFYSVITGELNRLSTSRFRWRNNKFLGEILGRTLHCTQNRSSILSRSVRLSIEIYNIHFGIHVTLSYC